MNCGIKKSLQWTFILLWFGIASGFVIAMSSSTSKTFDHDNRLAMQLMSLDFERDFVLALSGAKATDGNRIVHLTSPNDCFCQTLAKSHIEKLNLLVENTATNVVTLDIEQHIALQKFIPSTPAIAVINDKEQLLYFGPYSQGSGCFSSSGKVDSIVSRKLLSMPQHDQSTKPESIINGEAKGCYCHQPLAI